MYVCVCVCVLERLDSVAQCILGSLHVQQRVGAVDVQLVVELIILTQGVQQ